MKRRSYKTGPSDDYLKKSAARKAELAANVVTADPFLFKGFLAADGFITKYYYLIILLILLHLFYFRKGNKGMKLDSLWSRFLVEALLTNDLELADIAYKSCLCDLNVTVEGAQFGCPMSIGNYFSLLCIY